MILIAIEIEIKNLKNKFKSKNKSKFIESVFRQKLTCAINKKLDEIFQ